MNSQLHDEAALYLDKDIRNYLFDKLLDALVRVSRTKILSHAGDQISDLQSVNTYS
jgi:hypothetical protein